MLLFQIFNILQTSKILAPNLNFTIILVMPKFQPLGCPRSGSKTEDVKEERRRRKRERERVKVDNYNSLVVYFRTITKYNTILVVHEANTSTCRLNQNIVYKSTRFWP